MKPINLKAMMKPYRTWAESKEHESKWRDMYWKFKRDTAKEFADEAKANADAAKAEFDTVAVAVENVLHMVQHRCSARTVTAMDICFACAEIEKTLGISKAAMDGIVYDVDLNAQKFPHAYKYTPESTHFTVEFKRGNWYLTGCERNTTRATKQFQASVFPDAAKDAVLLSKFTF